MTQIVHPTLVTRTRMEERYRSDLASGGPIVRRGQHTFPTEVVYTMKPKLVKREAYLDGRLSEVWIHYR